MSRIRKRAVWALCGINALLYALGTANPAVAAEQVPIYGQCGLCIGEYGEAVHCCVLQNCQQVACDCAWASHCS